MAGMVRRNLAMIGVLTLLGAYASDSRHRIAPASRSRDFPRPRRRKLKGWQKCKRRR